ncbi:MAG: hypothetical protein MUF64_15180 [Polyangiaceae bacterium]|jgi:urease accessory protein|nr:hypothetical protein [Polyangiaceae bacterium]
MTLSLRLLALSDSAFPAGGFAHSGGLEAHASFRWVRSPRDVARFLLESTWQNASLLGPFLLRAHRHPDALLDLDLDLDPRLSSPVANRASRTQGRAFLATARAVFPGALAPLQHPRLPCCHHAPVYGSSLRWLGIEEREALLLFLFGQARGVISAAVRLGLVGPQEGQSLLDEHGEELARAHEDAMGRGPEEAASTFPLLELRQAFHDAMYARLFLS